MFAQKCKSYGNPIELDISETKLFDPYKNPFIANTIPKRSQGSKASRKNKKLQNNKKVPCGFKLLPQ
jgi:hypothetical protein